MWPFDVVVDAINYLIIVVVDITYIFFYPVVLAVNYLWYDVNQIYNVFAVFIDMAIAAHQTFMLAFQSVVPSNFPYDWAFIIFSQITISQGIRIYNVIRHVKSWVPFWGN